MKAMKMTDLLETLTLEVTKDFTDRDGNLTDTEILYLRKIGEQFEKMAEIAGSVKDLKRMKGIINEER